MGDVYEGDEGEIGWESLPGLFPGLGDAERWLPLLRRHAELLRESAPRVSTTTVDPLAMAGRLYAESLETLRIVQQYAGAQDEPLVVDVGSGGGFPGLVFAMVMPGWRVALVESLRKRASLLGEAANALGLENVEVIASRAEEAGRGPLRDTAQIVTARAVAELRELVEYVGPFAEPGGLIALPKGSRLPEEVAAAGHAMDELGLVQMDQVRCRPEASATPWTLLLRKEKLTPGRYPRRPGIPHKRPL